jgi:phosphohistidine phosphatase
MPALFLFRHAKAAHPSAGQQDFDRPLTERGRNDAAAIGRILAGQGIDLALVSAACRTRETWKIASRDVVPPPALSIEEELYLCSSAKLITRLRRLPANIQNIIAVGHNPCTQEVALWLARNSDNRLAAEIRDNFPTAALAIFDLRGEGWEDLSPDRVTLRRFVTPKTLD